MSRIICLTCLLAENFETFVSLPSREKNLTKVAWVSVRDRISRRFARTGISQAKKRKLDLSVEQIRGLWCLCKHYMFPSVLPATCILNSFGPNLILPLVIEQFVFQRLQPLNLAVNLIKLQLKLIRLRFSVLLQFEGVSA